MLRVRYGHLPISADDSFLEFEGNGMASIWASNLLIPRVFS